MFSGVAVALPAMGADLHAGATSLGLVETLFLAGSVAFLCLHVDAQHEHRAERVLATGSVPMAVMAPVAGWLADRYPARFIATCGVALVLLSALTAATLDKDSSLLLVIVMLAVQGLGFALFSSPNMTIIMSSVPANALSMASALGAKARSLISLLPGTRRDPKALSRAR